MMFGVWFPVVAVFFFALHSSTKAFLTFSNGKNDTAIGWQQAVEFYRALQETRQPHMFVWGQEGHNQRTYMPQGGTNTSLHFNRTIQSGQVAADQWG